MAENLRAVVADASAFAPEHILFNGDLARANGEAGDYAAFNELIGPIRRSGVPVHLTLGNHDDRGHCVQALRVTGDAAVAEKLVSRRLIGGTQWLLLDSLDEVGAIHGSLGPAQRAWLAQRLDDDPRTPTVVCVHHNPEPWPVGLTDSDEFLRIVLPRRQVKLILFGHTHQYRVWKQQGLHFVNLPAVGYRFLPRASLGWLHARVRSDGMTLAFRGITPREPDHGTVRDLRWRGDV